MELMSMERNNRFELLKVIRSNHETLNEVYKATRNGTPAETVKELVKRIGYAAAVETVAELVNGVSDWDGRIYNRNRTWAASCEALNREEVQRFIGGSAIHPAHIQQIADSMEEYTPVDEAF